MADHKSPQKPIDHKAKTLHRQTNIDKLKKSHTRINCLASIFNFKQASKVSFSRAATGTASEGSSVGTTLSAGKSGRPSGTSSSAAAPASSKSAEATVSPPTTSWMGLGSASSATSEAFSMLPGSTSIESGSRACTSPLASPSAASVPSSAAASRKRAVPSAPPSVNITDSEIRLEKYSGKGVLDSLNLNF